MSIPPEPVIEQAVAYLKDISDICGVSLRNGNQMLLTQKTKNLPEDYALIYNGAALHAIGELKKQGLPDDCDVDLENGKGTINQPHASGLRAVRGVERRRVVRGRIAHGENDT